VAFPVAAGWAWTDAANAQTENKKQPEMGCIKGIADISDIADFWLSSSEPIWNLCNFAMVDAFQPVRIDISITLGDI
jgi:hypothetical protein